MCKYATKIMGESAIQFYRPGEFITKATNNMHAAAVGRDGGAV